MITEKATPEEIRQAGYQALLRELGPIGAVRFIQQFDRGHGDFTKEREEIIKDWTIDSIVEDVRRRRGES